MSTCFESSIEDGCTFWQFEIPFRLVLSENKAVSLKSTTEERERINYKKWGLQFHSLNIDCWLILSNPVCLRNIYEKNSIRDWYFSTVMLSLYVFDKPRHFDFFVSLLLWLSFDSSYGYSYLQGICWSRLITFVTVLMYTFCLIEWIIDFPSL